MFVVGQEYSFEQMTNMSIKIVKMGEGGFVATTRDFARAMIIENLSAIHLLDHSYAEVTITNTNESIYFPEMTRGPGDCSYSIFVSSSQIDRCVYIGIAAIGMFTRDSHENSIGIHFVTDISSPCWRLLTGESDQIVRINEQPSTLQKALTVAAALAISDKILHGSITIVLISREKRYLKLSVDGEQGILRYDSPKLGRSLTLIDPENLNQDGWTTMSEPGVGLIDVPLRHLLPAHFVASAFIEMANSD